MGEFHARAYASAARILTGEIDPGVTVIAEEDVAKGRALADQWHVGEVTDDWRAAIDRSAVDLVDICTPPASHREIALYAASAGKHIYCEKPVGRSLADTEAITRAA